MDFFSSVSLLNTKQREYSLNHTRNCWMNWFRWGRQKVIHFFMITVMPALWKVYVNQLLWLLFLPQFHCQWFSVCIGFIFSLTLKWMKNGKTKNYAKNRVMRRFNFDGYLFWEIVIVLFIMPSDECLPSKADYFFRLFCRGKNYPLFGGIQRPHLKFQFFFFVYYAFFPFGWTCRSKSLKMKKKKIWMEWE